MLGHFHEDVEHFFLIDLTFLGANHLDQILMLQIFVVVSFLVKVLASVFHRGTCHGLTLALAQLLIVTIEY